MMDFERVRELLSAVAMAEAQRRPLTLNELAQELEARQTDVEGPVDTLQEEWGLILLAPEENLPPILLDAGRQYLARSGEVDAAVLAFLPRVIDDLHTRSALLEAGTILVDEFRAAVLAGDAIAYARARVPTAFAAAIDDRRAIDLFAASVALVARLSAGEPAGCVAEEVMAVALIEEAEVVLELAKEAREMSDAEARTAVGELRGVFELFQDDDTLRMLDMEEPSDAAVARHSAVDQQLGIADQRIEAWFNPFGWTAPTGYLADRPRVSTDEHEV